MELLLTSQVHFAIIQRTELAPSVLAVEQDEPKPFELRDYQKACIAQILQMWRIGKRAPALYAPTGSGKTAMASHIMNAATRKGHKVLFIVHREPLVQLG